MQPLTVVDGFDKDPDVASGLIQIAVVASVDLLLLQGFHEAFALRIVVGISRPAHAWDHAVLKQHIDVSGGRILDAAIGMMNQARRGLPRFNGVPERRERELDPGAGADWNPALTGRAEVESHAGARNVEVLDAD